jgi:hypothetical protein
MFHADIAWAGGVAHVVKRLPSKAVQTPELQKNKNQNKMKTLFFQSEISAYLLVFSIS